MLQVLGLKRIKRAIIRSAVAGDSELNTILQETVVKLNRLMIARGWVPPTKKG